ncbi:hypothetical protein ACKKBG_A24895 [Auxenochlorella protothecoides x Auxenochlorella symbiontica]
MARRSGGGGMRRAPSPPPRAPPPSFRAPARPVSTQAQHSSPRPSPPPPAPHNAPPPPAQPQAGGGMMSGIGGMLVSGMAMGTGSALGHRAVDAVLGSRHPEPAAATEAAQQLVAEKAPCSEQAKAFADCMSWASGDMGACQQYFDAMQQCRLNVA